MSVAFVIAKNTFKQAVRDKILYGILIFAVLFIGSTMVLSSLSLGEDIFIIKSFGLAGIYIFGLIITLFLGASIVYDEVERKTSYFLLSKPVSRQDIVWGKFMGLLAAITVTTALMAIAYTAIVILSGGTLDLVVILTILMQILETAILIAALILFSVFTTPLASIIYTILLLYIGHLLSFIKEYAEKAGEISKFILTAVYYIFPNLEKFNIRNQIVHQLPISSSEILLSLSYAVFYVFLLLHISKVLLNRKEL